MTKTFLRIYGLLTLISGAPSRGRRLARTLQILVRTLAVLGIATLVTYSIASLTRSMIDETEVKAAIAEMIAIPQFGESGASKAAEVADEENEAAGDVGNGDTEGDTAAAEALAAIATLRTRKERIMAELEQELGGKLFLELYQPEGSLAYSVLVGIGARPRYPPAIDPCAPELVTPPPDAICLFRVHELFPDNLLMSDFVEFQFPGTAYTIPQLVISAAELADSEVKFTRTRAENVRQVVEELIGGRPFLPSSSTVLWGRRLNGPIQFITYFLSSVALVLVLLAWVSSVSQNWAVHRVRSVPLPRLDMVHRAPSLTPQSAPASEDPVTLSDPLSVGDEVVPVEGIGPTPEGAPKSEPTQPSDTVEPDLVNLSQIDNYPTPWDSEFFRNCPLDLSNAQQTADYYDAVSRQIQRDSEVLGVPIDPPVLRFRRAAARAVANTEDTSILPSFLDAQKNSILSFYDARMSLVRFLLWVIPTVGFIGTILGVSDALSSTIGLQSASDLVTGFAQSSVSASMGMAFDTTLVALVAAVVVMLAFHIVQGAEERMTVLERDRAEEEVMQVSRSVRKPGGVADLAQQLISLGINTELLIRDIHLFQRTGPELAAIIQALSDRKAELEKLDLDALLGHRRRTGRTTATVILLGVVLLALLGFEGHLGQLVQSVLEMALTWFQTWF